MKKKATQKNQAGFTLVELVLVIIIIGILAALAIPQFTSSTDDAREATVRSNLATLRNAIQLFYHEHDSAYPNAATFEEELTKSTNQARDVNPDPNNAPDPAYPLGPYMFAIPDNPAVPAASNPEEVNAVATGAVQTVTATGGWNYDEATGQIAANSAPHNTY